MDNQFESRVETFIHLQKFLADAKVTSRRKCANLIQNGEVSVNGQVILEPGAIIRPDRDVVRVCGKAVKARQDFSYLILNKPAGLVVTKEDPQGRRTIWDLLPDLKSGIQAVGRLDYQSEGLILLTDDGNLAYLLTHPSNQIKKIYRVKVLGRPSQRDLIRITSGIELDDKKTLPAKAYIIKPGPNTWLRLTITEGRRQLIRRMFKALGYPVMRLKREAIGPLRVDDLTLGSYRHLKPEEVETLKSTVQKNVSSKPLNSEKNTKTREEFRTSYFKTDPAFPLTKHQNLLSKANPKRLSKGKGRRRG